MSTNPAPSSRSLRLLLVNEDPLHAAPLRTLVESLGYHVSGLANTLPGALALLDELRPNLVLVDHNPGEPQTGPERVRILEETYRLPFLFLVAQTDAATRSAGSAEEPYEAYGYLIKPFEEETLDTTLQLAHYRFAYNRENQRRRNQDVLLSLSQAIAAPKNKGDLLNTITRHLKPLYESSQIHMAVFEPDRQFLTDWCSQSPAVGPSAFNDQYVQIRPTLIPFAGLIEQRVRAVEQATAPQLYTLDGAGVAAGQPEPKKVLFANLRVGGQLLGFFSVDSNQKGLLAQTDQALFQAIADQIAVAVANVLAHEEMLVREGEKSALFAISTAIATVRGKQKLLALIVEHIQPLFQFYDCGLFVFDATKQYLEDWTVSYPVISPSTTNQRLAAAQAATFSVTGSPWAPLLQRLTDTGEPLIHDYQTDKPSHWDDYVQASLIDEIGYQESLMALLKIGGEPLGVFAINALTSGTFHPRQFHIFQVITDQLAVALANILANEEILEREREKDLQLALTNVLTTDGDWTGKMVKALNLLQPYLEFDYVGIWLVQGDKMDYYCFRQIGQADYQLIDPQALQRMTGLAASTCSDQWQKIADLDPQCLVDDAFNQFTRRFRLAGLLADLFKLESTLLLPMQLPSSARLLVWLGSGIPRCYTPADLDRLNGLMTAIRPSLEKLLAFDEIRRLTQQLAVEKDYLQQELKTNYNFEEIIGVSEPLQHVFQRISRVAPTDSTVLLEGETGTGKELFARAIHATSPRGDRVLVKVNCAALPATLIESELFGHEKGAFTGAIEQRIGKFELAHGGTLFLDEIGELPLDLQPKLLRALQEKEIERVGGRHPIRCDVRIIAATNRNLENEVAQGRFRQDLFYRLHVFAISLPPLRHRPNDVELLANHFLHKFAKRFGRPARRFSASALSALQAYDWPGNIRELEHVVEQALILSESPVVELAQPLQRTNRLDFSPDRPSFKTWQQAERENILAVLSFTKGRIRGQGGAAELLGLNASTLDSRMKTLGIRKSFGLTD